ncbi:MAG: class I SAM-dependent methyltransferase [bacterium]
MTTSDQTKPDKHLSGEGHAHHQFNPARAEEFREPDRLQALKIPELLQTLSIQPTDHVLDLGTGSGALLPQLSSAIPEGVVIGADISTEILNMTREYVQEKKLQNVTLLRNDPDQLSPHDETQDTVLIVSSLHEFSEPEPMLSEIHRVLKPGGQLGILEWRQAETPEGPPLDHRFDAGTIRNWLESAGFEDTTVQQWSSEGYDLYRAYK